MCSRQQYEANGKTNCIKVSGNYFPEIHWEPSNYWACNVLASSNQDKVCQESSQTEADLDSSNEKPVSDFRDTSTSSHFEQQQIPQCNQHTTNRIVILPNNYVLNGTEVDQRFGVPIQTVNSVQSLRNSYQHNGASNMSPYGTPGQSNGFMPPRSNQFSQFTNPHGKSHLAHISFIKTPSGILKTNIVKLKRKRTMFTTEQVAVLENVFFKKPYVNREERLALVDQLHLNEKAIKVWFQNRRLKDKREAAELEEEMYSPGSPNTVTTKEVSNFRQFDRLSYVEYLMTQADEHGYVTLDDRALGDIAAVIDDILPKDIQFSDLKNTQVETERKTNTMYEPISPAAADNSCNDESFVTHDLVEPKESFQRLLDLQTILNFDCRS